MNDVNPKVVDIVISINNGVLASDQEVLDQQLSTLVEYECWKPFFLALYKLINNPQTRHIKYYTQLAAVQNLHLEDLSSAAETCSHLVADLRIDFYTFYHEVLTRIIQDGDYLAEAAILHKIYPMFNKNADLIACLERLCLIHEKKRFNEKLLSDCYEKLIATDPTNEKALHFFKNLYTHTNDWAEVIRVLQTLYNASKFPNDKCRIAQEMAMLYQYQMDLPQKALETLNNYCTKSPLDTSIILYDAYSRLRDWEGCLNTLKNYLKKVETTYDTGVVYYKIGEIEERQGNGSSALGNYVKSIQYFPELLESYERIINLFSKNQDWISTLKYIEILSTKIKNQGLIARLDELSSRIKATLEKMAATQTV